MRSVYCIILFFFFGVPGYLGGNFLGQTDRSAGIIPAGSKMDLCLFLSLWDSTVDLTWLLATCLLLFDFFVGGGNVLYNIV